MKRIAFVCFLVLILTFQLTCVGAFNADNVSISAELNKLDVSVVSDKDLGRMTLQLLSGDGTAMIYMGQENSYAEEVRMLPGRQGINMFLIHLTCRPMRQRENIYSD